MGGAKSRSAEQEPPNQAPELTEAVILASDEFRKVQCDCAGLRIDEERWIAIRMIRINPLSEIHRRTPAEIVAGIVAETRIYAELLRHCETPGCEEQPVSIGRQFGSELTGESVDVRPQVPRRPPIRV